MRRRDLLKSAALLPALSCLNVATGATQDDVIRFGTAPTERLNQGPFDIDQDQGWQTILFTTPSEKPVRNPGLGLVGYCWEESGPSLAARAGRETLEQHVEKISSLPFVDILYIRCDWRNVQSRPGRLDLSPVWALTLDAAKRKGLRVAFRVQLSNYSFQPEEVAIPPFLRDRIPLANIGRIPGKGGAQFREPRYDHPEFQKAFAELNELLAREFDGNPLIEWVDLMQYGFWGEGHTSDYPNPFPDYETAERTWRRMTPTTFRMEEDTARGEHPARHQQCRTTARCSIWQCARVRGCAPTASSWKNQFRSIRSRTGRHGSLPFLRTATSVNTTRRN